MSGSYPFVNLVLYRIKNNLSKNIFYSALVVATGIATWLFTLVVSHIAQIVIDENGEASWILRLIYTILGYATIFLPCYVLVYLSKRHSLHTLGELFCNL